MTPFTRFEKNRWLRITLCIPVVSLAFSGGATRSADAPPRARAEAARAASPPVEEPAEPVTPAQPDLPSSVKGSATGGGVAGGVVVVSRLPTSPRPGTASRPRPAALHGQFLQNQPGSEPGSAPAPGGAAARTLAPPRALPYPQAPAVEVETARAAADLGSGPAAPGDPVQQWTGLSNTGALSPDTTHAVGPAHVVLAVNSGFSIYTKFGTQVQGYTTFESFLNKPVGWAGFMFDPRLIYDPFHEKFVMLVLGKDDAHVKSYYWLAVSQGADPTAGWWVWRFDVTTTVNGAVSWLDHGGLTADDWGVYVTGNYWSFGGIFRGSSLWSINPDILNGGATNGWRFLDLRWPLSQQAFGIQPAHPHSVSGSGTTFFVNTFNGVGSQVLLWKLSGDRTSSPTLTSVAIGTASYEAIGNEVDQPGSATDIYGGDARVASAVYSQGRVLFVLTDDVNNNEDSSGWLTVRLDVDANTNEWEHLLWGGVGVYYFYPALTLGGSDPDASLAVFGNWTDTSTSPGQFASGLYKIYDAQPATTGPLVSFTSGLAAYVALDGSGRNRFGSHSGAGYDWSCGHAWGSVEAADAGNTWRTVIAARQFGAEPACPQVEVSVPNSGQVWNAGTTHTITWQRQGLGASSSIDILFDPGTGDTPVASALASTASSFDWQVPGTPTSTGRIFVGSWTGASYEAADRSDADFAITAPDLRVISLSVSANLLAPGDSFTANATVENPGDGSSNVATTLRYYRSTDAVITTADAQVATDPIAVLGAGGNSVESAPLTAPAVGNYWIGACVDAVAGESNPANQCSAGVAITVTRPDLIVSLIDAPVFAKQGDSIEVSNAVLNQGAIGTGIGYSVGLYLSNDAACNTSDTFLGSRAVPALAAGASSAANTSVTIPSSASVGNPRYICAVADHLDVVVETDEGNNIGTDAIDIRRLVPTVNLKVNGIDAVLPAAVTTSGPVLLTVDMTPGPTPVAHYFAIIIGGNVLWLTSAGVSTTPMPLATFTPATLNNVPLLNVPSWSPGTSYFVWLMLDGGTVVNQDLIQVNVLP